MAIVKKRLNTSDYNLCNTDVYVEYDDEVYDIDLCNSENGYNHIVIVDKKNGNALRIFDASTTGFIVQKTFNNKTLLFVSYFDKENRKYYLMKYGSTLCSGVDSPVSVPSIKYELIYLGYGSFIINDEHIGYKYPGNLIYNPFQNKRSRNFRKIYLFEIERHPKYVHGTELISFEKDEFDMTRIYDEVTYGIDLQTLDICTPIYSERMNDYFEVVDEKPDDETLMYLDYMHGYYDINKPGDVTIINKIIKPLMAVKPERHVPDFKRLARTIKRT